MLPSNITIGVESFSQCIPEFRELCVFHYDEIAEDKDKIKLDPDYEKYTTLENSGILLFVTVRDSGVLIGYFIALIMPHLHYKSSLTAFTDIFFVKPECRGNGVGMGLMRFVIKTAEERGVQRFFISCKLAHDLDPLMRRLGFREIERVYSMTFESNKGGQ